MNKHGRIIEIRGFRGLILAIFIVCCLITGFTVFPGFIAMNIWNAIAQNIQNMPSMQLLHGVMLWGIIFLIWYAFNGKFFSLHFGCEPAMSDEHIQEILEQLKRESEEKQDKENE